MFLSYASEDAAAADRLESALREAGIDVWRDRSRLQGGESWDAAIRRQIRECALFVPLISRNAAARREGYFRLEWALADERMRMMSLDRVFIVPVMLDATRDAGGPESFLRAQWILCDGGTAAPVVTARIASLLATLDAGSAPSMSPGVPAHATGSGPATAPRRAASASVAVLPFDDMSPARDQEYFCDGTAEEITNALARIRGLRVASRSAAFTFKGRPVDPATAGRMLNVGALLHGSVRRMADRVRVTAQLVEASDGFALWSEIFDRDLGDIFAVQEEIARRVVDALSVRLRADEAGLLQWRGTVDANAYDYYLRGRQLLNKEKEAEQRAAAELFRQAIRIDPSFAQAHAGLADVLVQLLRKRQLAGEAAAEEAIAASHRAVELAPDLPETHVASGNVLQLLRRHEAAEAAFERALELDPRDFNAHYWFAKYWAGRGEHAAAARHYEKAFELRPDDYRPITLALQEYQAIGDAAVERSTLRRSSQALERHLALDPDDSYASDHAAGVLMLLGRREESLALLDRALSLRPDDYGTLYTAACTAALGGLYDMALDFLDRAVGTGRGHLEWILHDNDLAPLRELPRFEAIIARLRDPQEKPG